MKVVLETLQKVVKITVDLRSKSGTIDRSICSNTSGDGFDSIDRQDLLASQTQIDELEHVINEAVTMASDSEVDCSTLDAMLRQMSVATDIGCGEQDRHERMMEAVEGSSDGEHGFKGFANWAEYELGRLREDFGRVVEELDPAMSDIQSVWA